MRSLTPAKKALIICVVLLSLRVVVHPEATPTTKERQVFVKIVYDGDTFETDTGERVRFLGINSPEVAHHGREAEPYGAESTVWLKELLHRKTVRLVIDVDEPIDRYGRTLAWVYLLDGTLVNELALSTGNAKLMDRFGLPPELAPQLRAAAASAKERRVGLWRK